MNKFIMNTGMAILFILAVYLLMYGTKALAISQFDGFAYADITLKTQGLQYEIDYSGDETYQVDFYYWHDDEIVYSKREYVGLEELEETIDRHVSAYFKVKKNMNLIKSIR